MLRQLLVLLVIATEVLVTATLHARIHMLAGSVVGLIVTLHDKEVLVVSDDHAVDIGKTRVTERQIVDRIKQIGLANAVAANQTVDLRRQLQLRLTDVLIIDN